MERELIVDSKELLDAGYLIVPECVPPDRLESMRAHCEQMVERHKTWWAEQRTPDQPSGGEWEAGKQPRVLFDRVIDRRNHESVEFLFHETTYGISKQIMQTEDVVPTQFGMFCNPRIDHGPSDWHRDISPPVHGPVEAYYTDFLNNPPCYTQWNIALYDDDVFWLVPGSHRRFNTAVENQQLSISEHAPINGSIPIELRAGDGIVYLTPILHWGSNYSTKLRRTIQFAYRAFNNGSLTGAYVVHWPPDIADRLPEHLAARFRHFGELLAKEHDTMERMFRAMMARDDETFLEGLAELHSGAVGKMSCVVQLSKVAKGSVLRTRGPVGSRFTQEEANLLWQRFAEFDRLLQVDEPHLVPGFQCKEPTTYRFEEMPAMDIDEFIASW